METICLGMNTQCYLCEVVVELRHVEGHTSFIFNPLKAELNPIRHLLALVGARHIVHVSRIRVNRFHVFRAKKKTQNTDRQ